MANQASKSPKLEDNYKLWVKVKIERAENIDKETSEPARRLYSVFAWVGQQVSMQTNTVYGSPDPIWKAEYFIPFDYLVNSGYLGLEIYRSSSADPCTSTGKVLVGRTLIKYQKENDFNKSASYELLVTKGPEWVAGGSITLVTEVKKVYG